MSLFIMIGSGFGVLAALAAFVITYEEWSHHYAQGTEPFKHALKVAVVTFTVFIILSILAGLYFGQRI